VVVPIPVAPGAARLDPSRLGTGFDEAATELVLAAMRRSLGNPGLCSADSPSAWCRDLRPVIKIVREIQAQTGLELSITTFAEARSIAEIGARLAQRRLGSSTVVRLQDGDGEPMFVLPGLAGAIVELIALVEEIGHPGPVYALALPGLDGGSNPHDRVDELVHELLVDIRRVQPQGRIHLVGYSYGGTLALEIARLCAPADRGLVALIEPAIHEANWPLRVWLRFLLLRPRRPGKARGVEAPAAPSPERRFGSGPLRRCKAMASAMRRAVVGLARHTHQRYGDASRTTFVLTGSYYARNLPPQLQRVRDSAYRAIALYEPRRYDGEVVYLRTEGGDALTCPPEQVWPSLLPGIRFVTVPGTHASVVAPPHVAALGQAIRLALARYIPPSFAVFTVPSISPRSRNTATVTSIASATQGKPRGRSR